MNSTDQFLYSHLHTILYTILLVYIVSRYSYRWIIYFMVIMFNWYPYLRDLPEEFEKIGHGLLWYISIGFISAWIADMEKNSEYMQKFKFLSKYWVLGMLKNIFLLFIIYICLSPDLFEKVLSIFNIADSHYVLLFERHISAIAVLLLVTSSDII